MFEYDVNISGLINEPMNDWQGHLADYVCLLENDVEANMSIS